MGLCDTEPESEGSTWPRKRIMFLLTDGGMKLAKKKKGESRVGETGNFDTFTLWVPLCHHWSGQSLIQLYTTVSSD